MQKAEGDLDTIFGRDNELVDKICKAAVGRNIPFIALVGTPVTSVIATDLNAVCSMVEKRTGIPAVSVDTNGMDLYDKGDSKARRVIEKRLPELAERITPTPLDDIPEEEKLEQLADATRIDMAKNAGVPISNYGMIIAKTTGILDRSMQVFGQ